MNLTVPVPPRFRWPKKLPEISDEQRRIADDFMGYWLRELPNRYEIVERFNHQYPLRSLAALGCGVKVRTLELGAGIGAHLEYEPLEHQEYHCIELRENLAEAIRQRFPAVTAISADCQQPLPYPDAFFDRVVVVHTFEHLPDLPATLNEVRRILRVGGLLSVVYPCDPGLAYELARKISAERLFRKRYKLPYKWLIRREHINSPREIESLIYERLDVVDRTFFPLLVPSINLNLIIGMTARRPKGD